MKTVIDMIIYPWAYTKCGTRIEVHNITGNPSDGSPIRIN